MSRPGGVVEESGRAESRPEAAASAGASGTLVIDARGQVIACAGEGRQVWRSLGFEIKRIAHQAVESGSPGEALLHDDGGDWQVSARCGFGVDGSRLAVLAIGRVSSDVWSRPGILEAEKHQALCRLVSGMVHELRNPLSSISLTAELLSMRDELPAAVREKLADVVHHVDRAEDVLQSLRRFGREEQATMALHSLNELVQDAVRLEKSALGVRGVEALVDIDPELPAVLADASQLRLVVANLIRNAGEAMEGMSPPGRVHVRTSSRHGVVRLTVEDDGPGIPPEVLSRIFDPYFTTKKKGTGLGLTMAFGIVKAHGGHLWAENRRQHGARFLVDLPDPQHSTPARHETVLGIDLTQAPTHAALVVDSDEERLELVRRAIAEVGWKVHVASTAAVALRKLRAADFDAVVVAGDAAGEQAADLCARARLSHPDISGRLGVLLPAEPTPEVAARLRLVGARVMVGPPDPGNVQLLARSLVSARAARRAASGG